MYVCMYVCMYVRTYVRTYVFTYVPMFLCTFVCWQVLGSGLNNLLSIAFTVLSCRALRVPPKIGRSLVPRYSLLTAADSSTALSPKPCTLKPYLCWGESARALVRAHRDTRAYRFISLPMAVPLAAPLESSSALTAIGTCIQGQQTLHHIL